MNSDNEDKNCRSFHIHIRVNDVINLVYTMALLYQWRQRGGFVIKFLYNASVIVMDANNMNERTVSIFELTDLSSDHLSICAKSLIYTYNRSDVKNECQ